MSNEPIKILITGDFCPINRIEKSVLAEDYNSIFNDFIEVFNDSDLNIVNLECPLTESTSARLKTGPHQKAHPNCINVLKYANINLATMANNHILDYGSQGVNDTMELCKAYGINTVGIGRTADNARKPFTATIKKKKIAFLNYADNEFLTTPNDLFNCNSINPVQICTDIRETKRNHDYIVVIMHAGNEFYNLPSPRIKELYRYVIDQGVDAVISHHTHTFSGYEIYKSKPIFYGLGNFIYDWPGKLNENWNKGYVVKLIISDKIDFEIFPLKQSNEKPGVFQLDKKETEAFREEIEKLNQTISDDKQLSIAFQKYCNSVFPMYDAFIEPYFGRYITALRKRGLFPKFVSRKKRLLLLNIARCESHREVLLKMLKQYELGD